MPPPGGTRVLVFEPEHSGHQVEYVTCLLEQLVKERSELTPTLAIPAPLAAKARTQLGPEALERLHVQDLAPAEIRRCTTGPLWKRGFARWNAIQRAVARSGARAAYALQLDPLVAPLALGLRGRAPLGGILFRPSIHYGRHGLEQVPGPSGRRRALKRLLLQRAARNPSLRSIASLDELFAESALDLLPGLRRVSHLPEPLAARAETTADTLDWAAGFFGSRLCFVLPGVLARRKGIFEVVAALESLTPEEAGRLSVIFAGRVVAEDRSAFEARLKVLAHAVPATHVHLEDRFLSAGELGAVIDRADVVLLPYQRFVGSSGLLYRAAQAGRPVIAPAYGLMGWLVRRHALGIAVDTTQPQALAHALRHCLAEGPSELCDRRRLSSFAERAGNDRFGAALLADMVALVGAR